VLGYRLLRMRLKRSGEAATINIHADVALFGSEWNEAENPEGDVVLDEISDECRGRPFGLDEVGPSSADGLVLLPFPPPNKDGLL
jgi:hypothetical protein